MDITEYTKAFNSSLLRAFPREQIHDYHRPASPAAPGPPEKQSAYDLGYKIMKHRTMEQADGQVKIKSLKLHIFMTENTEKYEHEKTNKKLGNPSPP